ncbi:MAG: PadR family transcriptional regulator [Sphingobacteriales bacterium]|jgi:PadR family transcriptional regulator PadR|nr:PadR family transcriptional regulator [Sphingobacteriales bacterium]MBP9142674.1 PadR family transcriptional regulator [Chitinophagales bacterium]MDA0199669.1 PadR family transcriptional regulator [Bacteroidota bacterium]MBK6890284.1 PadR family transcriptional regulator [Sphingobacteriales bacterium]MBK7527190.1 PadR family transcriptional regulator [Sphingobacteriales bacterium]
MELSIDKVKTQMRRGILEFCVLNIIARGEMYPSDIITEMKAANLLMVEGTLYPLLNRLKTDGMLTYRWEESKTGPPRKYYSLTNEGDAFLAELRKTWNELVHAVRTIEKPPTTQVSYAFPDV